MIKNFKPVFVSIILIFSCFEAGSQQVARVTEDLRNRLNVYCTRAPREEVYIHSDRDEYIAGEDIWFSAYVFNRQSNRFSESSGLVYVELLNKDNIPVIQKRIKILNGVGPGQVLLPDTLSTGPYILRAYTNLMKNSLPGNCFIKKISIYNALNLKGSDKDYFLSNRFANITHMEDPGAGKPVIEVSGSRNGTREILINIFNNFSGSDGNEYSLVIESRGNINYITSGYAPPDIIRITVSDNSFVQGINHITLFNSKRKILSEKYTYNSVIEGNVQISDLSETYGRREKVSFSVAAPAFENISSPKGNFSISVLPDFPESKGPGLADYMIFGSEFGMTPWEFLNGRRMSDLSAAATDSLLMILKSNWIDWEKILSVNLPELKYPAEKDQHLLPGRIVNRDDTGSDSVSFVLMSSPGKQAVFQYAKTDSEGNFNLNIGINQKLNDLVIQPDKTYGGRKVKIESSFSEKYLTSELVTLNGESELPEYIKNRGGNFQVRKIYGTSSYGQPVKEVLSGRKVTRFYGKPDIGILLDDYIKLPVMEEVFFELIPGVYLRKRKSVYELKISDPVTYESYEYPPGMMVDGVIIKDPTIIGNIDPEAVEKIDIIKDRYYVGDFQFFGIVNIITRAGDFSSVTLPDFATRISYRVVEPVLTFASPEYSLPGKTSQRIPDFRNTLWWTPAVSIDKSGKSGVEFWTSDESGNYIINIEGITTDGKPVSIRKKIKIE